MAPVRQRFPASTVPDFGAAIRSGLVPLLARLKPGARIAVAVGSRGITRLKEIVGATVDGLRVAGAAPFIVPAMGSHGGATPEGQRALLAGYGVTADALGVPVCDTMDVATVGHTPRGDAVVCSVEALGADGVVLVNRVKPHTDFAGGIGSGLLKMLVVGLGKHAGAAAFHVAAARDGYEPVLRAAARVLLDQLPVIAGVAVVEDARHQPALVEVVPPAALESREAALCAAARERMPGLPVDDVDLLIVDRMGKNISGTGMDPAIIGRMIHGYSLAAEAEKRSPHARRLLVRDLTPETHGNAIGIGMADFTTGRLVRAMDRHVTMTNALTALSLQGAKVPIWFETDREAITAALRTLSLAEAGEARVVRIADTLSLEWLEVSAACVGDLRGEASVEVLGEPGPMRFDAGGNLLPMGFAAGG